MQQFDKARVFLDEDFTAVDKFTVRNVSFTFFASAFCPSAVDGATISVVVGRIARYCRTLCVLLRRGLGETGKLDFRSCCFIWSGVVESFGDKPEQFSLAAMIVVFYHHQQLQFGDTGRHSLWGRGSLGQNGHIWGWRSINHRSCRVSSHVRSIYSRRKTGEDPQAGFATGDSELCLLTGWNFVILKLIRGSIL